MRKTLSVLMPCFNTRPDFLLEAVSSVEHERDRMLKLGVNVNLLLVDDASTDSETICAINKIVLRYPWASLLALTQNLGPAGSRNRGLSACDSDFIAFLDSDDFWLPGGISKLCELIVNDDSIDWISGDFFLKQGDQQTDSETFYPKNPSRYKYLEQAYVRNRPVKLVRPLEAFLDGNLSSMGASIIRFSLLKNVGGFSNSLRKGVDTELYWRLAEASDMVFVPEPIFVYRRYSGTVSSEPRRMQEWELPVLRRMLSDAQWRSYRKLVKRRLIRTLVNLANLEIESGNGKVAYRYAWEVFRLKPIGKAYLDILGRNRRN